MSFYLNSICPFCENTISAEDELVVCPECGTPHHRACYFEHSHCFNNSVHKEGYEWKKPVSDDPSEKADTSVTCQHCGRAINARGAFCNYCGNPVNNSIPAQSRQQFPDSLFISGQTQKYNPEEKIDGIPIKDWIVYIGSSYNYYIYNFKTQDKTHRKTAFTLSAVIFPFLYFLYRRVWGAAIISAVMNLLLNLPYLILTVFIPLGIDFGISTISLDRISNVFSIVSFAVNLCWGLFAVWLYRKKACKHINSIKNSPNDDDAEYNRKLLSAAGPSKIAVIVVGAIFFGIILFAFFAAGFMSL